MSNQHELYYDLPISDHEDWIVQCAATIKAVPTTAEVKAWVMGKCKRAVKQALDFDINKVRPVPTEAERQRRLFIRLAKLKNEIAGITEELRASPRCLTQTELDAEIERTNRSWSND